MTLFRLLLICGLISGGKIITQKISDLADVVATVAVQMETAQMVEMIYLDSLDGTAPTPQNFHDYLRKKYASKSRLWRKGRH